MFSVGRLGIVGCGMNRRFGTRVREIDLFVRSWNRGLVSSMQDSMSVIHASQGHVNHGWISISFFTEESCSISVESSSFFLR
jgi:hypothetical protein